MRLTLLALITCLLVPSDLIALNKVDSLQQALIQYAAENNIPKRLEVNMALGEIYANQFDYKLASRTFEEALRLASELGWETEQFLALRELGAMYYWQDDYQRALECLFRALNLENAISLSYDRTQLYNLITQVYVSIGNYRKALYFQLQALHLIEEANDSLALGSALYVIGSIYSNQKRFDEALQSLHRAENIFDVQSYPQYMFSIQAATASVFNDKGDPDSALIYLEMAQARIDSTGDAYRTAFCQGILGNIQKQKGNYPQAQEAYESALDGFRKLGVKAEYVKFLIEYGGWYQKQQKHQIAIDTLQKALGIALEIDSKKFLKSIYECLAECNEALGNTEVALSHLKDYMVIRDTLESEKYFREMGNIQTEYEIQNHQRLLKEQESKVARSQSQMYWFIGGGLFFLLALAIWPIYMRLRDQRKTASLLAQKNREIEDRNEELARINTELRQFAHLASDDLKAPLLAIRKSVSHLMLGRYSESHSQSVNSIYLNLDQMEDLLAGITMYSILGEDKEAYELVSMSGVVEEAISLLPSELQKQATRIQMHGLPDVQANKRQMVQIMLHLISNAIKFRSDQHPEVVISCKKDWNEYVFSVRDNGRGIDPRYQKEMFELFNRGNLGGKVEGLGMGLAICRKILEQHKGRIWVESAPGKGSTFYFSLPSYESI